MKYLGIYVEKFIKQYDYLGIKYIKQFRTKRVVILFIS